MSVRSWPSYLLWNIPQPLRDAISQEARERDVSVAEVVRGVLCARYRVRCPQVAQTGYDADKDLGRPTILVRAHPELFSAIRAHSARFKRNPRSMKALIVEALQAHYNGRVE